jgi:hypothetical protein
MNIKKVADLGQGYEQLSAEEKSHLGSQVELALAKINEEPKTTAWKLRSKIGDRVKWYQDVDEIS